jgi:hypothetical protein
LVEPALKPEHKAYLEAFAATRRMTRNPAITSTFPDPVREAAGLPVGEEGGFYVGAPDGAIGPGGSGFLSDRTPDVVDYNSAPSGQPGLWCQWVPNEDGTAIEWDQNEKFYSYEEWLDYLLEQFLEPWGYTVNGECEWVGEDPDDRGLIVVENNVRRSKHAVITYVD